MGGVLVEGSEPIAAASRGGRSTSHPELRNTAVVIPTFNERENISRLVEILAGLYPDIHILVVDDRSPDGTAAVVRQLQPLYPNLMLLERTRNPSFAESYRDAFRKLLGEPWCQAILTMDADFSHDPVEVGRMVQKLAEQDVVVGSRYTHGGGIGQWAWHRRFLSWGANVYVRMILGLPVRDITSGFQCMRRQAVEKYLVNRCVTNGYAFQVELKFLLARAGRRMTEHPIIFDDRREGKSKMSANKIWESVLLPWRIRLRSGPKS